MSRLGFGLGLGLACLAIHGALDVLEDSTHHQLAQSQLRRDVRLAVGGWGRGEGWVAAEAVVRAGSGEGGSGGEGRDGGGGELMRLGQP